MSAHFSRMMQASPAKSTTCLTPMAPTSSVGHPVAVVHVSPDLCDE